MFFPQGASSLLKEPGLHTDHSKTGGKCGDDKWGWGGMTLDLAERAKEGFLEERASLFNPVLGPQDDVC